MASIVVRVEEVEEKEVEDHQEAGHRGVDHPQEADRREAGQLAEAARHPPAPNRFPLLATRPLVEVRHQRTAVGVERLLQSLLALRLLDALLAVGRATRCMEIRTFFGFEAEGVT